MKKPRNDRFELKLTKQEREVLSQLANEEGLSCSAYLRKCIREEREKQKRATRSSV